MSLRVRLLGRPGVEDGTGRRQEPPRGQKSWALLGRVALAERPLARSELAAELFPEAGDPLGALRWCLADLRRCLEDPQLLRSDPLRLARGSLWIDVCALWDGSLPAAEIGGELLAGVERRGCPAFGMWLMMARGRCAARSREELHQAALRLLAAGEAEAAAQLAGRAAAQDMFETLRRAAEAAERAGDPRLYADVLRALGSALVHSVRGFDGEGAVVLHRAMAAARTAGSQSLTADILRELAFVDLQAGRHASAARALREALALAGAVGDPALSARVLAIRGMNEADQGHHDAAIGLLSQSVQAAASAGTPTGSMVTRRHGALAAARRPRRGSSRRGRAQHVPV